MIRRTRARLLAARDEEGVRAFLGDRVPFKEIVARNGKSILVNLVVPDPLRVDLDMSIESGLSYELRGVRALESTVLPDAGIDDRLPFNVERAGGRLDRRVDSRGQIHDLFQFSCLNSECVHV